MLQPVSRLLHSFLLLVFVGSFSSIVYFLNEEPTVTSAAILTPFVPTRTVVAPAIQAAAPLTPVPTSTNVPPTLPVPEAGWSLVQPGLERRAIEVYNSSNQRAETLYIWRIDQDYFRLDVAHASSPRTLDAWQRETNAAIVVNAGYYSISNERYFPDGLTIVNGQASGRSFSGFGGMLAIQGDRAELRWLADEPYNAYEPLQAALQSFPMLVRPGGVLGYGPEKETYARARRTAIAQDRSGRILLMVAPEGYFTLHGLSAFLTESDLNLDIAVNLDGGGSTGILVAEPRELISPTRPIPFVILVYPR